LKANQSVTLAGARSTFDGNRQYLNHQFLINALLIKKFLDFKFFAVIAAISNIRKIAELWIRLANLQFLSLNKVVEWQKQGKI
jgi:hypothetical protein